MFKDHRYMRQMILPNWGVEGQRILQESRVLCIGAGGLGTPALQYLAASGIGTLGIMDHDSVDVTNLHRQVLYRNSQKGMRKSFAAKNNLLELNPHIEIEALDRELQGPSNPSSYEESIQIFRTFDIILDGTDNFETKYIINDICTKLNKPWVYAAVSQWEAQISTFWVSREDHQKKITGEENSGEKKNKEENGGENGEEKRKGNRKSDVCYRCLFPQAPRSPIQNCALSGVMGALPGLVGSYQAVEIIKTLFYIKKPESHLGPPLLGQLLILSLHTNDFLKIPISRSKDCQHF